MIKQVLLITPILLFHLILLSLLTFTAWPEMLSYPYLLANGFQIYKDAIIPYPPLLPAALSIVFGLFGYDPQVLRWFCWFLIVVVDVNLFIFLKMITRNQLYALLSLISYVILQSFLDGNMLWFDFATVVPLSFGLIFFWKWLANKNPQNLFITILFLTLGIAIKQTAVIYFLPVVVGYLLARKKIVLKDLFYSLGAFGLVWIPILSYLLVNNSFQAFWLWNFVYPLTEWSKFPGYVDLVLSRRQLIIMFLLIAPISVTLLNMKSLFKDKTFWILFLLVVCALFAVYPRFSFFHLQPALFCLTVLLSYLSSSLKQYFRLGFYALVAICILPIIYFQFQPTFNPLTIRFADSNDKFLTQQISLISKNKDIYLLGPASSQYVFAQKLPPMPWIDSFGWYLEIPTVQDQIISGLKKKQPEVIFWQQPQPGQWYELGAYRPSRIVSFILQSYVQSKVLDNGVTVWTRKN